MTDKFAISVWGFYDDENDATLQYIGEIESQILPDNLKFCKQEEILSSEKTVDIDVKNLRLKIGYDKLINVSKQNGVVKILYDTYETIECKHKRLQYIMDNQDKIVSKIKKSIQDGLAEYIISGVAVFLARGWQLTPIISKKINKRDRGIKFPTHLDKTFPVELKVLAYHASLLQLKEFDNHENWSNTKMRKDALEDQIKLFQIA